MKKLFITFFSLALVYNVANAQLIVDSTTGNVGIKSTGEVKSSLAVGGNGEDIAKVSIEDGSYSTLHLGRREGNGGWIYSGRGLLLVATSRSYYGFVGLAFSHSPLSYGRSYGLMGVAGNATTGWNYGVYGGLRGTNNGAAIFGTSIASHDQAMTYALPGRYAGYFEGPVYGTSTITATEFLVNSDQRFKKNISHIGRERSLSNVMKLSPVEYELQQVSITTESDTLSTGEAVLFNESSAEFSKKQFGLIAQDVEKIFPELVYEDGNGYKSVNYIGLIPMLIQSIQELTAEVEDLKANQGSKKIKTYANAKSPSIDQNYPNPVTETTSVKYYLPESVLVARLHIYDKTGSLVDSYMLTERGEGEINLSGHKLSAGNYVYTLMVDGNVIDSKQMIVE